MAFARWDPIRDLLAIQQRLDRFAPRSSGWSPAIDVYETADRFVVIAEVAGMRREDLDISVHDGRLTIAGARPELPNRYEQYHRVERGHGNFSRTFQLPSPVDSDGVTADLRDGVLTITCPKAAEGSSRRIQVS